MRPSRPPRSCCAEAPIPSPTGRADDRRRRGPASAAFVDWDPYPGSAAVRRRVERDSAAYALGAFAQRTGRVDLHFRHHFARQLTIALAIVRYPQSDPPVLIAHFDFDPGRPAMPNGVGGGFPNHLMEIMLQPYRPFHGRSFLDFADEVP